MNKMTNRSVGSETPARRGELGSTRIVVLGLVCLATGFGGGILWHHQAAKPAKVDAANSATIQLSEATQAILSRLDSPLEIRFYALLGQQASDAALSAFAARTDQLLTAFEQMAGEKLKIKRLTTLSSEERTAAAADGIRAFNREKGEAQYFGITVARGEQKETLAQLMPEWEQALESDLSRAIERVARAHAAAAGNLPPSASEVAATETVQRTLPNLASMTVEEGRRILREAALKEFQTVVAEGEAQLQTAHERLSQTGNNPSDADRQAAREQILQLQAAHTARLKDITARLEAQMRALERLKSVSSSSPK